MFKYAEVFHEIERFVHSIRLLDIVNIKNHSVSFRLVTEFHHSDKRAGTDSFNTLSIANGSKRDSNDPVISEEKADLTLRDAVNLALLRNPELAAFAKEMRALEGATLQAGLPRNPNCL